MLTSDPNPALGTQSEHNGVPVVLSSGVWASMEAWKAGTPPIELLWTSDGRIAHRTHWCEGSCDTEPGSDVYYVESRSGIHGWICCSCRKITQTG